MDGGRVGRIRRRRRRLVIALLPVLLVGCLARPDPVPPTNGPSEGLASPSAALPGTPEPGPSIDPTSLFSETVTCDGDIAFPADRLAGPGEATLGADAAGATFRAFLAGPDRVEAGLPATGWTRIDPRPGDVVFLARAGDGWAQVGLQRTGEAWMVDRYGQCRLRPTLPDGIGPAAWWLDPQEPPPAPGATEIHGLLHELACASGRSPEGRIVGPAIVEEPDRVIVLFAVRGQPGDQDCQGNQPLAIRFDLPSPLGTRQLFDGGSIPPRDATIPAD
jgi:hypothetical protein